MMKQARQMQLPGRDLPLTLLPSIQDHPEKISRIILVGSPIIEIQYCQKVFNTPCLALSSLYVEATSLNFIPALNFSRASRILDCFSHKMCRTY